MKLYAFLFSAGTVSSQLLSELGGWTKTNDGDYLNPRSLGFGQDVMEMTDYDLNLIDDARAGAGSKAYKKVRVKIILFSIEIFSSKIYGFSKNGHFLTFSE